MDFEERQRLVRRITSGLLYGSINYNSENYFVVIKDASLAIATEADFIYKNHYENLKDSNAITLEKSYEILKNEGLWSDDQDMKLYALGELLNDYKKQLPKLRFKKAQFKSVRKCIDEVNSQINELNRTKNQLYSSTIEFLSLKAKRRFVLSKTATIEPCELLKNPLIQDLLCVYYYDENAISQSQIRQLARSDPWRLYWIASKDTGTSLFGHSCTEMTDLQYALVFWSRVYDFSFESENRPTNDIIEDDEAFDQWYQEEIERINSQTSKNNLDKNLVGNEVFIPADREGAKEVYKLNNPIERNIVKQREKIIQEKGEVRDINFPDVRREVNNKLSQMAMTNKK